MPLTLPSNMQTDKNKQGHSPTLFIEFTDLTYYLATEDYTLDLTLGGTRAYTDLTKAGASVGTISQTVPADMNRNASTASLDITLVDYRGSLRSNIIGSAPNLTASAVNIYLIFETTNDEADRLQIFSGYIADYTIQHDIMTLKIETDAFRELGDFPQGSQLLSEVYAYNAAGEKIVEPLQYGDFGWNDDVMFTSDLATKGVMFAICPYSGRDASGYYTFSVSSHQMESMPTAYQISAFLNHYVFIRRDNMWLKWMDGDAIVTNTASGAEIKLSNGSSSTEGKFAFMYPTALYTGGSGTNPSDAGLAIDGKQATASGAAHTSGQRIKVHDVKIDLLTSSQITGEAKPFVWIESVTGEEPYAYITLRRKSDDTSAGQITVTDSTSLQTWIQVGLVEVSDAADVNDYYMEVEPINGGYIEMAGIVFRVKVNGFIPESDEACIYLRCQGRKFSGTWGSRKTSGALITHPIDMLESIWRDDLSKTDIDTTSFDAVSTVLSGYKVNASIFERQTAEAFFDRFAEQFNITNVISQNNQISIAIPSDALNYSASGTSSPDDEDILTDSETITSESFNRHPMKKGSFKLTRSQRGDLIEKLIMPYGRTFNGEYVFVDNSSGTGTETTINNDFLGHATTAASLVAFVRTWRSNQRFIASMTTFLNAIGWQIGDIRSVVHDDLVDAMMYDSVEGDKWIVFSIRINGTKGLIDLKLQNIPT